MSTEAMQTGLEYARMALAEHDAKYKRHPATESERKTIVGDIEQIEAALSHLTNTREPEDEPAIERAVHAAIEQFGIARFAKAIAGNTPTPIAWLYVDTIGERYLCFSKPTGGGTITELHAHSLLMGPTDHVQEQDIRTLSKWLNEEQIGPIDRLALARVIHAAQSASTLAADNERLRVSLRFYANGEHYQADENEEFDNVSGEPENWLCSGIPDSSTMIENGTIARRALLGKETLWVDADGDHTPAPIVDEQISGIRPGDDEHERALSLLAGLHPCLTIDGPPMVMAERIFDAVLAERAEMTAKINQSEESLQWLRSVRAPIQPKGVAISGTQKAALTHLEGGGSLRGFCHGRTYQSLKRNGWIEDPDTITPKGREALQKALESE